MLSEQVCSCIATDAAGFASGHGTTLVGNFVSDCVSYRLKTNPKGFFYATPSFGSACYFSGLRLEVWELVWLLVLS